MSGRPDPWRQVYGLIRCPGPPYDRDPYCWQDPATKKRYRLLGFYLRSLVKFVQQGSKLETYKDVPADIREQLYAEEQQLSDRKRKRQDSGSHPASHPPIVINNYILAQSGQATKDGSHGASSRFPHLSIPGFCDETVKAYCEWHCSIVAS